MLPKKRKHEGVSFPAEHHDGGLRIGSRRGAERGAVDDAQRVDAEDLVVAVDDDPADLEPSLRPSTVVVPDDGHDGVPAEPLQRPGVATVLVQQVHGELGRHIERRWEREFRVREPGQLVCTPVQANIF
jgi:hypothetical protein